MKDRSDDPSHYERTLLPRSYISLPSVWKALGSRAGTGCHRKRDIKRSLLSVDSLLLTCGIILCIIYILSKGNLSSFYHQSPIDLWL